MSYVLTAIVSMSIGVALGILMISLVSVTGQVERENSIYREGFAEGHRIGLQNGKEPQRVDVAPEPGGEARHD